LAFSENEEIFAAHAIRTPVFFKLFNKQNTALRAPALPIAASLILPAKLIILRENMHREKSQSGKKSAKIYHF
jgi:hypothetical protein